MMNETLERMVAHAGAALGSPSEIIHGAGDQVPRFALFHAANSICSQKARCVLAYHHLTYVSHPVNLFLGETYMPDYVRLRMIGCDRAGGALVSHHSGSTSGAGGCDGAVVPTLIDWQAGDVIVDSKNICVHLDEQMPQAARLRPAALADAIDHELGIVDHMPNYQMLMGRQVTATESALTKRDTGGSFSQRKVAWCDRYLAEYANDDALVQAYTAKRAKELSAATELFSPEAMQAAYGQVEAGLEELEHMLAQRSGAWLFGNQLTMADLFWGIELLRMANTGVATYWENGRLPQVERFAAASEALPAIRSAIIEWPGAMF